MRPIPTQARSYLSVQSPFGPDVLVLESLQGSEGLSELFAFHVQMRSTRTDLQASAVLGQGLSVRLQIEGGPVRHLHGMVSRFVCRGEDRDEAVYEADLVPRLWLLGLSRDRRIYQQQSAPEIVQSVLDDFGVAWQDQLGQSHPPLPYVVQYDETALDFVHRLMQQAGLMYRFDFAEDSHTLVLADDVAGLTAGQDSAVLRYFPPSTPVGVFDTVQRLSEQSTLVLAHALAHDVAFESPSTPLQGEYSAAQGEGSQYSFGQGLADSEAAQNQALWCVQASQLRARVLQGESLSYALAAGMPVQLQDHFVDGLNAAHVLWRVHHRALSGHYSNRFEALPEGVAFRAQPPAVHPHAVACETATVVGPAGEEVWCDAHGRIKLQFPWDRQGQHDDNSSPWVRVAQSLAGPGFGSQFLPRVGQEVVVSYLQGDPQQPLVTGCVYNGDNPPPLQLPDQQTSSVIRTRSSKGGQAGNEIRLDDLMGQELLYLHAQKDMALEVENALSTTVLQGSETHTLEQGDRTVEIKTGQETHKVAGARSLDIGGDEQHANAGAFVHKVSGDYELHVDGQLRIVVGGAIHIASGSDMAMQAGTALSLQAATSLALKAGTEWQAEAGTRLSQQALQIEHKAATVHIQADATQTVEAGAMLTLKGGLVQVN